MKYETVYTYKNGYAVIVTRRVTEKPDRLMFERNVIEAKNRKAFGNKQKPLQVQRLSV